MTTAHKPLRIFCSYSHKDEEYLNELRTWLRGLERQKLIQWWHDREIVPGWEWEEAIDKNLRSAEIILLLVTPDFMGSDYVHEKEIGKAVERHDWGEARVIPIIVRPSYWEWARFGKLQALPKDARPITTWVNQDEAWLDVVRGIRKAVENLTSEVADEHTTQTGDEQGKYLLLRYREGVELAWADGNVDRRELEQIRDLATSIGLSPSTAAGIEREVMGDTIEAILEDQKHAPPPPVEVPDLGGQNVSQASSTLSSQGLTLGAQNRVPHDTIPEGKIIKQSPEAGTEVEEGSAVRVTVSSGPVPPTLAGSWWALAVRGLVMGIFGLVLLFPYTPVFEPGTGDFRLYGTLMIIADWAVAAIDATTRAGRRRPMLIQRKISGLVGLCILSVWLIRDMSVVSYISVGAQAYLDDRISDLAVAPRLVGSWAIVIGLIRIIAAIQLRRETANSWLMGTSGVLVVLFGIVLWPSSVDWWRVWGLLALASGITLTAFAFRARTRERSDAAG